MSKEKFFSSRNITWFAALVALIILFQSLAGVVIIGGTAVNLSLVPIVLGAIIFGAYYGAALGFVSGIVTLLFGVFGTDALTKAMFDFSPWLTSAICLIKCTVAGLSGGFIHSLIKNKNEKVAVISASAVVPVVNTCLFVSGACFFKPVFVNLGYATKEDVLLIALIGLIGIQALVELLLNVAVSPALYRVSKIVQKRSYR